MVSGISQNFAAQGTVGTAGNPVYIQQAPAFRYEPAADTAEFAGKKKSGAKKTIFGTLAAAAVTAAALFGLVKTGKLTKIDNPTKWTGKLQNLAYTAGDKLVQGYEAAKKTDIVSKGKDMLSSGLDWVKGLFNKNGGNTAA